MNILSGAKLVLSKFSKEALSIGINRGLATALSILKMSKNKQEKLYWLMKKDLEQADEINSPSPLWKILETQFLDIITIKGIENFKDEYINRHFAAYAPNNRRIYESLIWQYYQNIKTKDSLNLLENLEEPRIGGKGDIVLINGKRFTLDLLQSIDEFYCIFGDGFLDPKKKQIILEFGAGYGRLAYVILKALPKTTYVILDLPSSLLISQYYLPKTLPGISYSGYKDTRLMNPVSRKDLLKKRLWFFGGFKFPFFENGSVDVFVNIYSMQEMKKNQIKCFLDLASKKACGRVYLKQHFVEENPINSEKILPEDYTLEKQWKVISMKTSGIYLHSFEKIFEKVSK